MIWDNEPKNPLKCTLKVDRQILNSCLFWLKRQNNGMRYVPMFTFPQSTLSTMSSVATLSNRPSTSTKSTMPTLVTNSIMSSMSKSRILIIASKYFSCPPHPRKMTLQGGGDMQVQIVKNYKRLITTFFSTNFLVNGGKRFCKNVSKTSTMTMIEEKSLHIELKKPLQ